MTELKRVIVGLDGSKNSQDAAGFAGALARGLGLTVVAVHAVGLLDLVGGDGSPVPSQGHRAEIAAQLAGPWSETLADLVPECRLVDGNPVTSLLRTADTAGDIIVVGSRGVGGVPGLSLGSTSSQLSQLARVPVVIVPLTA